MKLGSRLGQQQRHLLRRRFISSSSLFSPTEEHAALRDSVRTFVERHVEPQADQYNREERFNRQLFSQLGSHLGILGLTLDWPADMAPAVAVCIVHEELAYSDPAFCLSYLAHSLLLTHNLYTNSSPHNDSSSDPYARHPLLESLTDGSMVGGMAMSEPNAGTDVLGMQTTATWDDATNEWVLTGNKMWITNGYLPVTTGTPTVDDNTEPSFTTGDAFLVYARTGPARKDITQFLVPRNTPGFSLGQRIVDKLGMRASPTAELVFRQVRLKHVVGTVHGATLSLLRNLEIERLGLASMSLGIARRCCDEMRAYASHRTAFGRPIAQFGQVQQHLAESYAAYMAGRSYVYALANAMQLGTESSSNTSGFAMDADATKLFCSNMGKQVADRAIQVLGGNGYIGEYKVERFWRDAKLLEIGGGTSESHHKNIVRDWLRYGTKLS